MYDPFYRQRSHPLLWLSVLPSVDPPRRHERYEDSGETTPSLWPFLFLFWGLVGGAVYGWMKGWW